MCDRITKALFTGAMFAAVMAFAQTASAGRVIVNHDEWTLSNAGFTTAATGTTAFAQNLAAFMNTDGGDCNLLVYSDNFGLRGSSLKSALEGAGCSVAYSPITFDLPTLGQFDGVLLAGTQNGYDAATLAAYVNGGGSAYIAAGTGLLDDSSVWDAFMNGFGLDFGPNYNGIIGTLPIGGSHPLLSGVPSLYFDNGNTVSRYGVNPNAQIIANNGGEQGPGLLGIFDNTRRRVTPTSVPEPTTLALAGLALAGLGFSRRKSR